MALSKAERDALPDSSFAFPRTRQGPMPDENHTSLAWDMIDRTKGVTDEERKTARERVLRRAHELGMDTSSWNKLKAAMCFEVDSLDAMALNIPHVEGHPNRMPFSGVLTKIDQPSDKPVHGSMGKLVIMTRAAAEAAIPSLLGMAVDFTPGLDDHDKTAKIGFISAASIDGDELKIEGFFYAADFPEETARIQADKAKLGFSYETAQNHVESLDGEYLVLTACTFTGAAVLRKDKAAYQTTSLAAKAAGDIEMTKEEFQTMLDASLAPFKAEIEGLKASTTSITTDLKASREVQAKVKPHADALRACADGMEAAGIGSHPSQGHQVRLRRMADTMEAAAALGQTPHIYRDHDYPGGSWDAAGDKNTTQPTEAEKALKTEVETLKTQIADLKAAASDKSTAPERKTVPPAISALLARAGVTPGEDGKVTVATLDAALSAANVDTRQRLTIKRTLERNGQLVAA